MGAAFHGSLRGRFRLLFAAAVLGLAGSEAYADSTLRYKFQTGVATNYVMTQSTTMEMQPPNAPNPIVTKMQQKMHLEIVTDEVLGDGSAKQRQIIRRVTSTINSEGGPIVQNGEFDSASEDEPVGPIGQMLAKTLKPMVGAEWQQTINIRGEISDIQIPEKMLEGLKNNPAAAAMGTMATADGLKQISTQAAMSFPEPAMKVGETFDSKIDVKLPFGTMSTRKITKYLGPDEASLERFGVSTEVEFQPAPNALAKLAILDNESEGEILFDNQAGRLIKSTLRQVTGMEITVGPQVINQTVTTNVLFELDKGLPQRSGAE